MTDTQRVYDAIVVGAGPSGCTAAIMLAKKGREVLLLERAKFPRDKVCGDAASGKTITVIRELGLLKDIEALPHGNVKGITMFSPNNKSVSAPYKNAEGIPYAGYTIRRMRLDNVLFNAAKNTPAITLCEEHAVTDVLRDEKGAVNGVVATDVRAGVQKKFHARIVIGCDGAASVVSPAVGLPAQPRRHLCAAVRAYYQGVTDLTDHIELYFTDGVLPGYLWIFPMEDGYANVGLGMLATHCVEKKINPIHLLERTIATHPVISPRFKKAKIDGAIQSWPIPLGSYRKKNTGDGWLLAGDAASLADPFSGEGIGNACMSGKYAAEVVHAALDEKPTGVVSAESLREYERRITTHLRKDLEVSYTLQRLSSFRFLLSWFLDKAATKPHVRQVFIDMLGSQEMKEEVKNPLFYLKLLFA